MHLAPSAPQDGLRHDAWAHGSAGEWGQRNAGNEHQPEDRQPPPAARSQRAAVLGTSATEDPHWSDPELPGKRTGIDITA